MFAAIGCRRGAPGIIQVCADQRGCLAAGQFPPYVRGMKHLARHLLAITSLSLLVACGGGETQVETGTEGGPVSPADRGPLTEQSVADIGIAAMVDRMIVDGQQLGTLLATIDSAETAEAVRPNIEAMIKDYKVMFNRFETMDQPSFSDIAALASRGSKLAESQQTVMEELRRIYTNHPEASEVLREALDGFGQP